MTSVACSLERDEESADDSYTGKSLMGGATYLREIETWYAGFCKRLLVAVNGRDVILLQCFGHA